MALHVTVLAVVIDAALGAWLGVMAFFSFVGAPRAFAVFGDEAGAYVNDVFPRYYRLGVGLGSVAFVATLVRAALVSLDPPSVIVLSATAAATLLAGYSLSVLIPRMDAAGDDAFEASHRQSVILNGLTMLAVAVALVGAHLP